MIIVDTALRERVQEGRPVRVGLVGAGFMGAAIARQIATAVPGLELSAIANRTPDRAVEAYGKAGREDVRVVTSRTALEECVAAGRPAVTDDPALVCEAEGIEVIVEATGAVEFAAGVVVRAIASGKHVIAVSAELDGTVGPILKRRADEAGVIFTGADGDQPGAEMNLYRFVVGIGLEPLLCGNVKGLLDHYRTPETQEGFARQWGQRAPMVTGFADGTKISYEQAVVANATGMRVARRGMVGYRYDGRVDDPEHLALYDEEALRSMGGAVDYVLGASPGAGVFVLAAAGDPERRRHLDLYKMGAGPLYCFYTPYHLCYFEVPLTIARAVLAGDAAIAPRDGPVVEVVATAKRDLRADEVLDGIGWYTTYGQCENHEVARRLDLLPMGLAEGCRLTRDVARDEVLRYEDVELPRGRLADELWAEQEALFSGAASASEVDAQRPA
ncbi:MAG TPA: hypothetical protein VE289_04795 [Gaiellaceae bacterium]|nr:hypothetical protein [Gaiellaceae bacterium]